MLKWAKYLSQKVSPNQIAHLLKYYRELNWVDQETEEKMLSYFEGSKIEFDNEDLMEPDMIITEDGKIITEDSEESWKITMEDHTKSLEFIGKIKNGAPIE